MKRVVDIIFLPSKKIDYPDLKFRIMLAKKDDKFPVIITNSLAFGIAAALISADSGGIILAAMRIIRVVNQNNLIRSGILPLDIPKRAFMAFILAELTGCNVEMFETALLGIYPTGPAVEKPDVVREDLAPLKLALTAGELPIITPVTIRCY